MTPLETRAPSRYYKGPAMLCILIANFLSRQANVLSISPSQYSYLYCSELFYDSTILNIYGVSGGKSHFFLNDSNNISMLVLFRAMQIS